MVSVDQARKIILKEISPLQEFEILKLSSCLGRIAFIDIRSKEDIPPFDNSAMDGFAVRAKDVQGASRQNPKILEVIEDVPAGYVARKAISRFKAIRIMTGAPIPKGADCVVMVENTRKARHCEEERSDAEAILKKRLLRHHVPRNDYIEIFKEVRPGENVRKAGEDVKKGEPVIKKGTLLKSAHIGLLASVGIPNLKVSRKPRVGILATGDELVEIDQKLKDGKIRNSNAYSLYGQAVEAGAIPLILGIAKDSQKDLEQKIKKGLAKTDMLLVCGGISVGDYDFVKDVLKGLGTRFKFWKVAMRPGKPLVFGLIQGKPILGLPGNPVSSMVSFEVFVRPALLKMLGQSIDNRKEVDAVLEEDIKKKKAIKYFLRARTYWEDGIYLTKTTGPQGSGILKSMALANSLIILPEEEEFVQKGTRVVVRFLD